MAQLASLTLNTSGSLDLSNTTENTSSVGNLWYDSADNRLKYSWYGGTWSTGGNLITGRCYLAGTGEQNASLAFGPKKAHFL